MVQAKKHKIVAPTLKGENIQSPFRDLGLNSVSTESKEITKEGFLENQQGRKEDKVALLENQVTLKEHRVTHFENRLSLPEHLLALKENQVTHKEDKQGHKENKQGYFVMFSVRKIKNQSIFIV